MKRFLIGVMGGTVLLIGVILLVLPGPGVLVMLAGLAILATEYAWARHYKQKLDEKWGKFRRRGKPVE